MLTAKNIGNTKLGSWHCQTHVTYRLLTSSPYHETERTALVIRRLKLLLVLPAVSFPSLCVGDVFFFLALPQMLLRYKGSPVLSG